MKPYNEFIKAINEAKDISINDLAKVLKVTCDKNAVLTLKHPKNPSDNVYLTVGKSGRIVSYSGYNGKENTLDNYHTSYTSIKQATNAMKISGYMA